MNAAIVKKITIIIATFIAVILLSVGCNFITRDKPNPSVTNPDTTFLSYGNVTITRQSLYDRMKIMEGISHLINYVDEFLLAHLIDGLTQDEVDEEITRLKFGTTDQEKIDGFTEDELIEIEKNYRLTLIMGGFNPDQLEDVERFVRLSMAREQSAREQLRADIIAHENQTIMGETEKFYTQGYRGDLIAIQLLFASQREAEKVYMHFNLVPFTVTGADPGLRLFVCDDEDEDAECDITKIARADFDEDNTRLLESNEVLYYYILMHNYLYAHRTQLDEDTIAIEDVASFDEEYFKFEFNDMYKSNITAQLAIYLFDTLGVYSDEEPDEDEDDNPLHYTVVPRRYSTAQGVTDYYVSFFKVQQDDLPDLDELDQERIDELTEEMLKSRTTSARVTQHNAKLRYDNGFVIHDTHLKLSYQRYMDQVFEQVPGITGTTYLRYEENKDKTLVATLDDVTVEVDAYFDYLVKRIGALFSVELLKEELLIQGPHFDEIYGSSRDYSSNRSQKMRDHRNIVLQERQNFANYAYAPQFTPDRYEWRDFLYVAYGFASDEDLVRWLVVQDLLRYLTFPNFDFDKALDYVQDTFDNYFSLRVEHLLVYVDFTERLIRPDDFIEYLDELTEAERTEYGVLKGQLETMIKEAIEGGQTMRQVADEYKAALRGEDDTQSDYSKWAVFKNKGFLIKYEDLSAQEALNYNNTQGYAEAFVENLQRIYANYLEDKEQDTLLDDRLFETEFGLHLVRARKSTTGFERPSALFENEDNTYDERWENDNDMPTLEQITIWAEREFERRTQGASTIAIPTGMDAAIKAFFGAHHDRFYPSQGMDAFGNMITINNLLDDNVQFPIANDHIQAMLSALIELYDMMLYPELD